ncbi:MAG: hypothetical protein WDW38_006212 [Sanguina aurantia]
MQACEALSQLMRKLTGIAHGLDINMTQPRPCYDRIDMLNKLHKDLKAAAARMIPSRFVLPKLEAEHTQLLTCFAALVTALVTKLELLDSLTIPPGTDAPSKEQRLLQSNSDMRVNTFICLWELLYTSCSEFKRWPSPLPVRDQNGYRPLREAMHSLMVFYHRFTHGRSQAQDHLLTAYEEADTHSYPQVLLSLPLLYLLSLRAWPLSPRLKELSALPADFISLLCCLSVELLSDFPAAWMQQAEQQHGEAHPSQTSNPALSHPVVSLCAVLTSLTNGVDLTFGGSSPVKALFVTPAVIQMYKSVLVTYAEQPPGSSDMAHAVDDAVARLTTLTETSIRINRSVAANGILVRRMLRPSRSPSDSDLLRALFRHAPLDTGHAKRRLMLVKTVVEGWDLGIVAPTGSVPFPAVSCDDQEAGRAAYINCNPSPSLLCYRRSLSCENNLH